MAFPPTYVTTLDFDGVERFGGSRYNPVMVEDCFCCSWSRILCIKQFRPLKETKFIARCERCNLQTRPKDSKESALDDWNEGIRKPVDKIIEELEEDLGDT